MTKYKNDLIVKILTNQHGTQRTKTTTTTTTGADGEEEVGGSTISGRSGSDGVRQYLFADSHPEDGSLSSRKWTP
jgi:hypothetical protein